MCCPLGGFITRHRAVEFSVSADDCVVYILPLLSSYKYDDIVGVVLRQAAFLRVNLFAGGQVANWGGRAGGGGGRGPPRPPPKYAHASA